MQSIRKFLGMLAGFIELARHFVTDGGFALQTTHESQICNDKCKPNERAPRLSGCPMFVSITMGLSFKKGNNLQFFADWGI